MLRSTFRPAIRPSKPGLRGALMRSSICSMTWTVAVRPKRAISARGIASLLSIGPVAVASSSTALVGFHSVSVTVSSSSSGPEAGRRASTCPCSTIRTVTSAPVVRLSVTLGVGLQLSVASARVVVDGGGGVRTSAVASTGTRPTTRMMRHVGALPPYRYELGLLHLQKQRWAEAATSLRRGFVDNPYIAEILCGNPDPMPLPIWEGSNWQGTETAKEYVREYGELWRRTADALKFVRWLHMHPRVMAERAAVIECRQELLWENDYNGRGLILDRERAVYSGIESTMSREIIKTRTDRSGQPMAPWKNPRAREWPSVH